MAKVSKFVGFELISPSHSIPLSVHPCISNLLGSNLTENNPQGRSSALWLVQKCQIICSYISHLTFMAGQFYIWFVVWHAGCSTSPAPKSRRCQFVRHHLPPFVSVLSFLCSSPFVYYSLCVCPPCMSFLAHNQPALIEVKTIVSVSTCGRFRKREIL